MLVDTEAGRWMVTTESGSQHVVDLDARTITRVTQANGLRKDGDAVPLIELLHCIVGETGIWVLDIRADGVETVRRTTLVKSIEAAA
jgi:hypothetical protein